VAQNSVIRCKASKRIQVLLPATCSLGHPAVKGEWPSRTSITGAGSGSTTSSGTGRAAHHPGSASPAGGRARGAADDVDSARTRLDKEHDVDRLAGECLPGYEVADDDLVPVVLPVPGPREQFGARLSDLLTLFRAA